MIPGLFILLSALIWGGSAFARPIFQLNERDLNSEEREQITKMFRITESALPPKMRQRLQSHLPINIEFVALPGHSELLRSQGCVDAATTDKHIALGKVVGKKIKLSSFFLILFKSGNFPVNKNCERRLNSEDLQRTLIHELSHIYDFLDFQMDSQGEAYQSCQEKVNQLKGGEKLNLAQIVGKDCERMRSRKYSVSDDPVFLKLAQFTSPRTSKVRAEKGLVRPYERTNSIEYFSMNMELFITDKNYPCRRPAHYRYLSEHFQWHRPISCQRSNLVYLADNGLTPVTLDTSRVYEIHYLFAGKGEEMMSRWGHGMFRIVLCAPEHRDPLSKETIPATPLGSGCLADTSWHVVVSFRANVDDIIINQIAGIFGKYESIQFLLPFGNVVDEYNKGEFRDVYSIPLTLNDRDKSMFLEKVLENYWDYRGTYKFFANNCADESLDLMQTALSSSSILYEAVLTPLGLLSVFNDLSQGRALEIRKKPLAAKNTSSLFRSELYRILQQMKKFDENLDLPKMKVFLAPGNQNLRQSWYRDKTNLIGQHNIKELLAASHNFLRVASFLSGIEAQSQIEQVNEMKKNMQKKLETVENLKPGSRKSAEQDLQGLIERSNRNFLPLLLHIPYGLPLKNEQLSKVLNLAVRENRLIREGFSKLEKDLFPREVQLRQNLQNAEEMYLHEAKKWQESRNVYLQNVVQDLQRIELYDLCRKDLQDSCLIAIRQQLTKIHPDLGSKNVLTDKKIMNWLAP